MSLVIVKCFNTLVINIFLILSAQRLLKEKISLFSFKTVFWVLFSLIPCTLFCNSGYSFIFTVLSVVFLSIAVERLFCIELYESAILTLSFMILSIITDLLFSLFVVNFYNYETIRNTPCIFISTNFIISISTYFLYNYTPIGKKILNNIENFRKFKQLNIIIYVVIAFFSIGAVYYLARDMYKPTVSYFITNIVISTFVGLIYIYMCQLFKSNQLEAKNNILYECMRNIESYQEEQDLKIHEYKNQLSKITAITDDKEVINKIEEILNVDLSEDIYLLGKIKNIPKSELKSLIYYKLLVAKKDGIKLLINVSPELSDDNYNFSRSQEKTLSNIVGIFFDNAIEGAKSSKEKEISLEIYDSNLGITFSISNTFSGKINLDKLGSKGYTTKGKSHGNGLHFVKKMLSKNNGVFTRTIVNNNHFIQKIIIEKEWI